MDIVLFGIQGSGKGTQAKFLASALGYDIFETGAELRQIASSGTELGNHLKSYIDRGELAPHEIVLQVVKQAILTRPLNQNIIFDGIPRDLQQKEDFDSIMTELSRPFRCVRLVVNEEMAIQRIVQRATEQGRADDRNEEFIRRRIQIFHQKTVPAIEAYAAAGNMIEVDGEGSVDEVFGRLRGALSPDILSVR